MDKVPVASQGRVTSVNTKRNEITLKNDDGNKTIKVAAGFDFYEVEGLNIKAWYTGGEVVLYTLKDEAKFDATKGAKDEITLVTEDEDYDVARNANLVLNGESVKAEEFTADYAKVALNEDSEVIWAKGYTLPGTLIVKEVKDKIAYDYDKDEVNLSKYDLVKDGKTISIDDLEEEDVLLYNHTEKFAVVYNNSKVGEIERVYTNSFRFDGKVYDTEGKYLDGEDFADLDDVTLDEMKAEEKDVEIFFNLKGEVVLVVGARGKAVKTSFYARVTFADAYPGRKGNMFALEVRNEEGNVISYDIAHDKDEEHEFFENTESALKLAKAVKLTVDKDGDLTDVEILDVKVSGTNGSFKLTDSYVKGYRLQNNTIIFHGEKKAAKLSDIKDFTEVKKGEIFADESDKVVVVIATETNADTKSTVKTDLVSRVRRLSSDAYEFTFVNGDRYVTSSKVTNSAYLGYENEVVSLSIGETSGLVTKVAKENATTPEEITSISTGSRKVNTYSLVSGAVVYDVTGTAKAISLSDLAKGDTIKVYFDDENTTRFVNIVVRTAKAGTTPSTPNAEVGLVTASSSSHFVVDSKTAYFTTDKTILRDKDDKVLLTGKDLTTKLSVGDKVDVKANGTDAVEVKILNTATELAEAAAQKVVDAELTKVKGAYAIPYLATPGYANETAKAAAAKTLVQADVDTAKVDVAVTFASSKYTVTLTPKPAVGTVKAEKVITISVAPVGTDATLKNIYVNGFLLDGFASDIYEYDVELADPSTHVVSVVTNDLNASKSITQAGAVPGTATIVVTAQDGTTALTYKVNFTAAP